MLNEAIKGLEWLEDYLQEGGLLRITERSHLFDRRSYYITFGTGSKSVSTVVSEEFLSDFPNMSEQSSAVEFHLNALQKRFHNCSPKHFYSKSNKPLKIEIKWPMEILYGLNGAPRSATYVEVLIGDLSANNIQSSCNVTIGNQTYDSSLKRNPFLCEKAIIKTVLTAIDRQELELVFSSGLPSQPHFIKLEKTSPLPALAPNIERFLMGKVYWLGFRQGDRGTKTWIADPWDADYLGIDQRTLIQTAQVLESQGFVDLDDHQEFASAGRALLQQAGAFEIFPSANGGLDADMDKKKKPLQWDIFICHASEDKETFVHSLAQELQAKGLRVWYDDFTLKIGDRLRRSIDSGLLHSRFGVIVLSKAFFQKGWPQYELDGLVTREVDNHKVILPVWHEINQLEVKGYSPTLAGRMAVLSSEGVDIVVEKLLDAMNGDFNTI